MVPLVTVKADRANIRLRRAARIGGAAGVALLVGCSPGGPQGVFAPREEPVERERVFFRRTIVEGEEKEEAIRRVRESLHQDGVQSTGDWIQSELKEETGQILFPEWGASRIAPGQYTVRFTYSLIRGENEIVRRGYMWNVDTVLGLVGAGQKMSEAEMAEKRGFRSPLAIGARESFSLE